MPARRSPRIAAKRVAVVAAASSPRPRRASPKAKTRATGVKRKRPAATPTAAASPRKGQRRVASAVAASNPKLELIDWPNFSVYVPWGSELSAKSVAAAKKAVVPVILAGLDRMQGHWQLAMNGLGRSWRTPAMRRTIEALNTAFVSNPDVEVTPQHIRIAFLMLYMQIDTLLENADNVKALFRSGDEEGTGIFGREHSRFGGGLQLGRIRIFASRNI